METKRDSLGFVNLDEENLKLEKIISISKIYTFEKEGKKYYFKEIRNVSKIYNELIAEELAKEFGLSCVHYDLAVYEGMIGVISEDFITEKNTFVYIYDLINLYYSPGEMTKYNNLNDIIEILKYYVKNPDNLNNIINQIIKIFVFDIATGNYDRHIDNYGVETLENGQKRFKIYDNTEILTDISIEEGIYALGIDRTDYKNSNNKVEKFLQSEYSEYRYLLEEAFELISEDNINKILKKVEERIKVPIIDKIQEEIKEKFKINKNMIKSQLKVKTLKKLNTMI